ncbi:MAG TPA: hypothetical protein VHT97_14440 [Acidimicrobiales bacterium]|nr:hypothetical protein [Acidimicrobiales bacterium]
MTPSRPDEAAKQLDIRLSEVAGALFDVDNGTDMVFVRGQADAGNAAAAALVASLALACERYPLAKDAVERLQAAIAGRDHVAVDQLLGPAAVTLPDATTISVAALLEDIGIRVDHLGADVARMASTAREAVARLDGARTTFGDLLVRATAVGAADDVELTEVRTAIERDTAAVAADPAGPTGLGDLDALLDAARERVELLERRHRELPAELAEAGALLDEIEALVVRGADALARTREKVAAPAGVVAALDLSRDGDRALRPWLDRIRDQAASGGEEAAGAALDAWRRAADATRAEAQRVADANAAPLARRNELRGLLDAYRAKAAASGGDEDGRLARLYAQAKDVLYSAPCALDSAEALLQDYVAAVNSVARGVR